MIALGDQPQQVGLAALGVADDDQVRVAARSRARPVRSSLSSMPRGTRSSPSRRGQLGGVGQQAGSIRTAGRGGPGQRVGDRRRPGRRRPSREVVGVSHRRRCAAARRGSAARRAVRPRPGDARARSAAACGRSRSRPGRRAAAPAGCRTGRACRGRNSDPAGGGDDHVDAVAEAAGGEVGDRPAPGPRSPAAACDQPSTTRNTSP